MVVRADVLRRLHQLGIQSLLIGRTGEQLSAGDDSEICLWYMLAGYRLYYCEEMRFHHCLNQKRLDKQHLQKLLTGFKECNPPLLIYKALIERQHTSAMVDAYKYLRTLMALAWRIPKVSAKQQRDALKTQLQILQPFGYPIWDSRVQRIKQIFAAFRKQSG